jgi:hypothetical protein
MLGGEIFVLGVSVAAVVAGIAFADYISRNAVDALDDSAQAHGDVPAVPEELRLTAKASPGGEADKAASRVTSHVSHSMTNRGSR